MFEEQITESIEAGAPNITYSGNEGPKSPQQEQMMQQQMMEQEQQMMAPVDYSSPAFRIQLIEKLMADEGLDYGAASQKADWIIAKNSRQGAAFGGIMGLDGRRQYGLGSKLKKFVRNIIPNEISEIAVKAAPFVAPFNPLAAGLMAGIGGFDQTGKIGSSIKSGLMNYGMGQGARYLGGADLQKGLSLKMPGATSGGGIGNYFSKPTGSNSRFFDNVFKSKSGPTTSTDFDLGVEDVLSDTQGIQVGSESVAERLAQTGPKGIMETLKGFIPESTLGKIALGGGAVALGTALLGQGPEETVSAIMDRGEKLDIDGIRAEVTEAFKDSTGEKLLALRSKYPYLGTQASKNTADMAMGGRAGYAEGKKVDYEEDPLYINQNYDEMTVPLTEYEKALREMNKIERQEEFEMLKKVLKQRGNIGRDLGIAGGGQTGMERQMELLNFGTNTPDKDTGYKDNYSMKNRAAEYLDRPYFNEQYETGEHYAMGGRIGKAEGGIMDLGGMELDYRAEGGFVPIGAKEKADDVPARLSVNEFVFTADAVRNAGGGDIDQGAEIMERVMKNLEQGGQLSEESQGMQGARDMFQTSQRLGEVV
jgi:tetrahydromethanopterin S-methyltransferase subunit G